jgi:alkanesulfonate monooxygenase SsuD/methylene tetrahydromethanopterin reductase-like flavin-dependent oxidoreductase (luciferase family)
MRPALHPVVVTGTAELHVAVGVDGYGWHRQAWLHTLRADPAAPSALSGRHWSALAATAERGLLDLLTIDDSLTPQPGRRAQISPGRLAGRGDAVLTAARVAAATEHIGVMPVATVTHTDPARTAHAIATLDAVSGGRAGWQVRVTTSTHEAALFGRPAAEPGALFGEATRFVDTARRCWDAAEPPPPQRHPVIAALAHSTPVYEFAAATTDLVFVTPTDDDDLRRILAEIAALGDGRPAVWPDIVVTFGGDTEFGSDAAIVADSAQRVAELIVRWHDLGAHGVRVRPAVLARDLPVVVDVLVPLLQQTGRFRTAYRRGETLRERLALPAPRSVRRHREVVAP